LNNPTPRPAPGPWPQRCRAWLDAHLPTAAELARYRWLRPFAPRLADRQLWRARGEPLARGVAVGIFWAFVVPVAQVLFAAVHCVWWRASIPVAAAVTFITNPITIGGWLVLAYHAGAPVVEPFVGPLTKPSFAAAADVGWLAVLQSLGLATVVGMGLFAVGGAIGGYLLVRLASALWLLLRRRRWLGRRLRAA
jgi:uncharacterized protein